MKREMPSQEEQDAVVWYVLKRPLVRPNTSYKKAALCLSLFLSANVVMIILLYCLFRWLGIFSFLPDTVYRFYTVHHTAFMLKAIMSDISDKQLYRKIEKAYDLIQSSPVKSATNVLSIESQVISEIDNLGLAVRNGDATAISASADKIARLANERNRLLRLSN